MTQGIPRGTKIETRKTKSTQGTNSTCDRSVNNNNDPFLPDVSTTPGSTSQTFNITKHK